MSFQPNFFRLIVGWTYSD